MGHSCVYRCDRCGAQSEPNAGSDMPAGWAELDLAGDEPLPDNDPFAADLCPACVTALQRWLEDVS